MRPSVPKRVIIRGPSYRTLSGQQFWQLRNIRRNPPRLVFGEQLGRLSSARLILEINIGKLLAVVVAHDKAGLQFFDGPGRREAAGGVNHYSTAVFYRRLSSGIELANFWHSVVISPTCFVSACQIVSSRS
jgi:hypothetical protein